MSHVIAFKKLFGNVRNKFVESLSDELPFQLPGVKFECAGTTTVQHCDSVETIFHLADGTGLEVDYSCRIFEDTMTAEVSGKLRNTGSGISPAFFGPMILNPVFEMTDRVRMRTISGGGDTSTGFPPPAYRISDTLGTVNQYGGKWSGRSTEKEMPYIIVSDEEETSGFFMFLEWSGKWILGGYSRKKPRLAYNFYTHPACMHFRLEPGEELDLPRGVIGFFSGSLDDGGNALRRHFAKHIRRDTVLPVFFNHYYAFAEAFDENDLIAEADFYAGLGCEYFVVDGGWFLKGFRDGIGNWDIPDPAIFPSGLDRFADHVRSLGMKFGLWFEPEFAMSDSSWAQKHPECYMDAPGRFNQVYCRPYQTRLFRFNDPAARKCLLDFFIETVNKYGIEFMRWDSNEALADFWEANDSPEDIGKTQYSYITGLYQFLDDFRAACPEVHIETCAGGGHRMDPGLLRRADSAWMSDNVWIHSARSYQRNLNVFVPGYANSLFRPWEPFESIPMDHFYSRFAGALGFSERMKNFSPAAAEKMKQLVVKYKEARHLLMKDHYRLYTPSTLTEPDGWQFHDPETDEGMFSLFRCESTASRIAVPLRGLSAGRYEAVDISSGEKIRFSPAEELSLVLNEKSDAALFHYHKIP